MKKKLENLYSETEKNSDKEKDKQSGFSLVEVIIALLIFLIAVLGVFSTFTYAVSYNAGNNARSQALAVMQQEVELLRSAKFTRTGTEAALLGGTKSLKPITSADGNKFSVKIVIDDDPFCPGIQPETAFCATTSVLPSPIKEISVKVTLANPTPGWQIAVPAEIILRRVRAN